MSCAEYHGRDGRLVCKVIAMHISLMPMRFAITVSTSSEQRNRPSTVAEVASCLLNGAEAGKPQVCQ